MAAYNVVRLSVKAGHEQEFLNKNRAMRRAMTGLRKIEIIKTGDRAYCLIGEWDKLDDIVAARPEMIRILDSVRGLLEDLGGGLGVTDPVAGEAVLDLMPA